MKRLPILAALPLLALLASACHRDSVATPVLQPSSDSAPASNAPPLPTPPTPEATTAEQRIVLAAGQSAAIAPGATLAFVRIINDSRCPADVQCAWAGEVTIALTLTTAGQAASAFEMSTGSRAKASMQGFDLELVSFEACPPDMGNATGTECATLTAVKTPQ